MKIDLNLLYAPARKTYKNGQSGLSPHGKVHNTFYKGKKVFITGHTGFKGSWLCKLLANAGADVTGYSLNPPTSPSLFEIANIESDVKSVIGDCLLYTF